MESRSIARELALLGMSQLSDHSRAGGDRELEKNLAVRSQTLDKLLNAAIQTLSSDAKEALEVASGELQRGSRQLLESETRASEVSSARAMVNEAIELTQTAINRLGTTLELPAFIQLANQTEVQTYARQLLTHWSQSLSEIDAQLDAAMVGWNVRRLARIDRDMLRIATIDILYLGVPKRVAIDEAIKMAKRYSDDEGYRFINGVMRRLTERLDEQRRGLAAGTADKADKVNS
ncbi:transcription antitermination protein NusB [Romeria aff. gracilis LEGE 07310]|uniref:Transcription antitermination protein NusB n=1 Tax=Vasconcelosia minhoensis LEGE 07310 TaxID=915328 RepID=A0A8J7ATU9_9CYAN|nr:transcription antitermination factor NusB [Romeria gracilis]MBE9076488.1 transcription antitermination protein NusB [Romeria aff. gracilis LEGE 07310]